MVTNSWDIDHLSIPEKFLYYSQAYIHAAKILCEYMLMKPESETYLLGSACAYNARHSVELFLKAAILKKSMTHDITHVLEDLSKKYKELYPEEIYKWDIPFVVQVVGYESEEDRESIIKKHTKKFKQDQMLRYPTNIKNEPWNYVGQFEAGGLNKLLSTIENDMQRLNKAIFS